MRPEEIRKLLGGYAAGNLTPEEQQALFAAALEDQELFDALAREQALRDVLRDPASRAELLTALDRPASGLAAFWQWLSRPMVARLVTAGVAVIAIVAVWRGTRYPAPDRVIVAELRQDAMRHSAPVPVTPVTPAPLPPPASPRLELKPRGRALDAPAAALDDKAVLASNATEGKSVASAPIQAAAPPPPPPAAAPLGAVASAEMRAEKEKDAAAPAELMARKKEAAKTQSVVVTGAMEALPLDARAIFYRNEPAPAASAFAQPAAPPPSAGGGAALPPARQNLAAAPALGGVPPSQLGVRASILRGDQEVDLTTVLNAGESVRLKLIPNADGYLRVTEAGRTVASAAVQRFKPFETPALPLEGASPKHFVITFSRTMQPEALSLDAASRGNLVEPRADQGRATYVVSGARQVVVPVTLNFK